MTVTRRHESMRKQYRAFRGSRNCGWRYALANCQAAHGRGSVHYLLGDEEIDGKDAA